MTFRMRTGDQPRGCTAPPILRSPEPGDTRLDVYLRWRVLLALAFHLFEGALSFGQVDAALLFDGLIEAGEQVGRPPLEMKARRQAVALDGSMVKVPGLGSAVNGHELWHSVPRPGTL